MLVQYSYTMRWAWGWGRGGRGEAPKGVSMFVGIPHQKRVVLCSL